MIYIMQHRPVCKRDHERDIPETIGLIVLAILAVAMAALLYLAVAEHAYRASLR